jgi:hypothetical protein
MSDNLSRLAVDAIEAGELNQAGEHLKSALMAKAKEAVDIKRVEMSTSWMDKQEPTSEDD